MLSAKYVELNEPAAQARIAELERDLRVARDALDRIANGGGINTPLQAFDARDVALKALGKK